MAREATETNPAEIRKQNAAGIQPQLQTLRPIQNQERLNRKKRQIILPNLQQGPRAPRQQTVL
jgi:hypothetical protein